MSHETLHAGVWTFLQIYRTLLQQQGKVPLNEQEFMEDGLSKWASLDPNLQNQFSTNAEACYQDYRQRCGLAPNVVFHEFAQPSQDVVLKKSLYALALVICINAPHFVALTFEYLLQLGRGRLKRTMRIANVCRSSPH